MNWLKRTIEKHNSKLTYADCEEHWDVDEWLCSLVSLTSFSMLPFIAIAIQYGKPIAGLIGSCLGSFSVWWHFWHILH